eukprot:CAMPEP_0171838318 /NCGR_PEP_ID=MMETSP0992-20121227/12689_1 /TAXON_ID=483369 /ORGANISM="non described non described, Strain CCMP2098" /LENGTH=99 /DNA_ID=CAMNT_0012454673 /DNA_START=369 /DNA_END=663 /DNA_ORIENTATION=+
MSDPLVISWCLLPPHSVDDHTHLLFRLHPVDLASSLSNSSAVHSRAPAAAQKSTAAVPTFLAAAASKAQVALTAYTCTAVFRGVGPAQGGARRQGLVRA